MQLAYSQAKDVAESKAKVVGEHFAWDCKVWPVSDSHYHYKSTERRHQSLEIAPNIECLARAVVIRITLC